MLLPRRGRGLPTFAALLAALLVVSALAFQARRAEQDQRATADRALREYAGFAAWEFASNAREQMWLSMTELLRPVEQLNPSPIGAALPSPVILAVQSHRVAACHCANEIPASYYFRLNLEDSALAMVGGDDPDATAPDRLERRWLRDTIASHARALFEPGWRFATVVGSVGGRRLTVSYTVVRDTAGRAVAAYGVVSESTRFMTAFAAKLAQWDLLPPALQREARAERLVSVIVRDEQHNVVYRSPWQFPATYSASYELQKFLSGFTVQASLKPEAADTLVFGGTHRFPLLLVLLGITAVLVGIAFQQLRREAALARLRADFVSSISHELRTPLSQIRMFAELLRMGWVRSEQERTRSLEIIDQEARRLGHLVERALRFGGAGRGEAPLVPEPTVLAPFITEVLETLAPLARARQMSVRTDLDPTLESRVDRGALRQVLVNLVDNAMKYGPAGQTLRVVLRAGERGWVRVAVEDEGPGIPEGERAVVWEPFRRLARDANSAIAGSGIGLSVVRRLVEAHGGRASVESSRSGGACFVVDLPQLSEAPTPVAGAAAHHRPLARPRETVAAR